MARGNLLEVNSSKIGITRVGSKNILTPKGPVTQQNIEALKTMFNESMGNNKSEIILDCKSVPFMDSKALELILEMHDELKKQGGTLKLININAVCRDIFIVTRLINVFHIYDDIHKAIRGG